MKRIFVVDDDEDTIDALSTWWGSKGFFVQGFCNSSSLYAALDKQFPDILLLDVRLGLEDGRKISTDIRKRYVAKFPIVLFSVFIDSVEVLDDTGADAFVKKDVSLRELTAIVTKYLKVGYE